MLVGNNYYITTEAGSDMLVVPTGQRRFLVATTATTPCIAGAAVSTTPLHSTAYGGII